jgi:L,D-transpeptidase YcbB
MIRGLVLMPMAAALLLSQNAALGPTDKTINIRAALQALAAPDSALKLPPDDRLTIAEFYHARDYTPLWFVAGRVSDRARIAIARLKAADSDGLRPADYAVPDVGPMSNTTAVAAAELWLTDRLLAYARHAELGRIPYTEVSHDISYPEKTFDAAATLAKIADSQDVAATLESFSPPHAGYAALKRKLAELLASPTSTPGERYVRQVHIDTIVANMERWRWLPRDIGDAYVVVNIPDFTLAIIQNGAVTWKTRTIVGANTWRTPLMSADMTSITLNPIWHVPDSLVKEELAQGGDDSEGYFDRIGMRSFVGTDGKLHLYQLPNGANALGRIRFNFPNKFLVFQHDTPIKDYFDSAWRAYSHGCMRVEHPLVYAAKLLAIVLPEKNYTERRLFGLLGGDQYPIKFPHSIPVHLTYQTAFVDSAGVLQFRNDVYGYDERMRRLFDREPATERQRVANTD